MLELTDTLKQPLLHAFKMLNRNMEDIKTKLKLLEMKATMSEVKITLDIINGNLDIAD